MEIRTYFRTILRHWFIIMLVATLAGGTVAIMTKMKAPSYKTSARVVARPVASINDARTVVDLVGQMAARSVVGTFAQLFTGTDVQNRAVQAAGLSPAVAQDYSIDAAILPDSLVIEVTGTGPDPVVLARYVNATVSAAVQYSPSLFQVVELAPLQPATVPDTPISPQPARDIPLGIGFGLLLGVLLALTFDYLRTPKGSAGQLRVLPQSPTQSDAQEAAK
jgi:tyrosine-protein kinase